MTEYLLNVENLSKSFQFGGIFMGSKIMAVDNVSLRLPKDNPCITSIVGESGSGKTTLARMILGLLDPTFGEISLDGRKLKGFGKKEFYRLVQPIFQNPFSTFSARNKVDTYLYETARNIAGCKSAALADEAVGRALDSVGLGLNQVKGKYPNQFSGGELQRISIARALIPSPKLIIADEPVAMVDASMRMNIVNLFKRLRDEYKVSFIYVTHDLSTAYYVSDYIATMYRGNVIEYGNAKLVLGNPAHPYTKLLLDSIPKVGQRWSKDVVLPDIESKEYASESCRFAPRCPHATEQCRQSMPGLAEIEENHLVLCYKYHTEKNCSSM